jgi:hypothetical protein
MVPIKFEDKKVKAGVFDGLLHEGSSLWGDRCR